MLLENKQLLGMPLNVNKEITNPDARRDIMLKLRKITFHMRYERQKQDPTWVGSKSLRKITFSFQCRDPDISSCHLCPAIYSKIFKGRRASGWRAIPAGLLRSARLRWESTSLRSRPSNTNASAAVTNQEEHTESSVR